MNKNRILIFISLMVVIVGTALFFKFQRKNVFNKIDNHPCIITIDGSKYDFSTFRNSHEGGDVFECGSDMSQVFHNQHPDNFLRKIARYKI